jgi:hypothetical protein
METIKHVFEIAYTIAGAMVLYFIWGVSKGSKKK